MRVLSLVASIVKDSLAIGKICVEEGCTKVQSLSEAKYVLAKTKSAEKALALEEKLEACSKALSVKLAEKKAVKPEEQSVE